MGEVINASVVFVLGCGSIAIIAIILVKFAQQFFNWAKGIRF
jgi:threonine dehydrogenase-like Zn-dependent dehydrogenase